MDQKIKYTREMYMLQTKITIQDKKRKMILSQIKITEKALEELHKTNETKVYKIVGNILIKKEVDEIIIELKEKKKMMSYELKDVEKELENDLAKFKEFGAKYSIHTNMQSNDYTLNNENNIFDMSEFIKKSDN